jgi:Tol biopolymer transport system component
MLARFIFSALALALAVPAVAAAAPAGSGAVVFSKVVTDTATYEKADGEKFVKDPEGGLFAARNGRLNQLTENPGDGQPSFSADGRTIAFVRDGDLYTMRADGSGQRRLTSGPEVDSRPIFAPSGRFVLFERREPAAGSPRDLFTVGAGGGRLHALTTSAEDDHEASFSRDGRTIVFVRSVAETGGGTADDLYSVRSSGARLKRLTRTGRIDEFAPRHCASGIAFSRGESGEGPSAYADIYTMRADGRKLRELIAGAGSAYVEDVTPNGRLLLFRRDQGLWAKRLVAGDERGPRARKLTDVADNSETNAVFSSDGREVAAFVETETETEARQTLTAIAVANRRQRQLAEGFAYTSGTVTTTIGATIAWQPVRSAIR